MPSPMVIATIQAAFLSAIANIVAQLLTLHKENLPIWWIDFYPIIRHVILRIINCPPQYLWQLFLEDKFPSVYREQLELGDKSPSTYREQFTPITPSVHRKAPWRPGSTRTHWPNTVKKFLLDQTIASPIHAFLFITIMSSLQGDSPGEIWETLQWSFEPLMITRMKFWPIAAFISFTVIPPRRRVLFSSLVSMTFTIALSIIEQVE